MERTMAPKRTLKPSNLVQTIERASSILDILAQNPHGITLRDLSSRIKLPKGTIHHLKEHLKAKGKLMLTQPAVPAATTIASIAQVEITVNCPAHGVGFFWTGKIPVEPLVHREIPA
jgi:hypothetical protein